MFKVLRESPRHIRRYFSGMWVLRGPRELKPRKTSRIENRDSESATKSSHIQYYDSIEMCTKDITISTVYIKVLFH